MIPLAMVTGFLGGGKTTLLQRLIERNQGRRFAYIVNEFADADVDGQLLELETADDDRGRVIGRQGRVAKAMRALLAASQDGADCRLEIVD